MFEYVFRYSLAIGFKRKPPSHLVSARAASLMYLGMMKIGKVARPTWGSMSHLLCVLLAAGGTGSFEKPPELLGVQSSWAPLISD